MGSNCPSSIYALSGTTYLSSLQFNCLLSVYPIYYHLIDPRNHRVAYFVYMLPSFLSTIQLSTICISNSLFNRFSKFLCRLSFSTAPFCDIRFKISCVKCKLPILLLASTMEFGSWKDNPIDTRTRIVVGVIP